MDRKNQTHTKLSFQKKAGIFFILATFVLSSFPIGVFADTLPTVDVKVNGQDGPITVSATDTFTYSWTSTNATTCSQTSPTISTSSLSDSSGTIDAAHPFFPKENQPTTITYTCKDDAGNSASDSVVINLAAPSVTPTPTPTPTPSSTLPTVDVKVNGQDGPITVSPTDTFTYSWTSTNATTCSQTSPTISTSSLSDSSGTIDASHEFFFPTTGHPTTITFTCKDDAGNSTHDSVVINLSAGTNSNPTPNNTLPTVDVKANGSDGPITLTNGSSYVYSWVSSNATSCSQTEPLVGTTTPASISLADTTGSITPDHPFYPRVNSPVTITIVCKDDAGNSTHDSVVINLSAGTTSTSTNPTVDVKANGSDGPVTLLDGAPYVYSWVSSNANSCVQESPLVGTTTPASISLADTTGSITPGHPFYPTVGSPVTIKITCKDKDGKQVSDSVTVIAANTNPGGGSCPVPVLTSAIAVNIAANQAFTYVLTSASSTSFSVATASLPAGFSYSTSTNTISGTVTTTGSFSVPVTLNNNCGNTPVTIVFTAPAVGGGSTPVTPVYYGGGNGGGGSVALGVGGHRNPEVVSPTTCLLLHDYMREDFVNDPDQVTKLQSFLKDIEGYSYVNVNGVFDNATFQAVSAFQTKYNTDILTPWGLKAPTGYVYILTLKKVNEIYCKTILPLNQAQAQEITAYNALIQSLESQGIHINLPVRITQPSIEVPAEGISTTTPLIPVVGLITSTTTTSKGQNLANALSATFSLPATWLQFFQCLYEWLLILVVLYILGSVLKDVLYEDKEENVLKRFMAKWITISVGIVIAIVIAYLLKAWCLILPLLIALILAIIWMLLYPKQKAIKAKTTTWYSSMTTKANGVVEKKDTKTEVITLPEKTQK